MRVLCNWLPSRLNSRIIAAEFSQMLATHGITVPASEVNVRPPRRLTEQDKTKKWHQDDNKADGDPTERLLLILWSNKNSTRVRDRQTKQQYPAASDGDVLLIDNDACQHQMPPGGNKRWLAIGIVSRVEL